MQNILVGAIYRRFRQGTKIISRAVSFFFSGLKRLFRLRFPVIYCFLRAIHDFRNITFNGWGLITTSTFPPWFNQNLFAHDPVSIGLLRVEKSIIEEVGSGSFVCGQFHNQDLVFVFENLRWRHYLLYSLCIQSYLRCAEYRRTFNIVECGVCDGVSTRFLCDAAASYCGAGWHAFLYDSWSELKSTDLVGAETKNVGEYGYLDISKVRSNLLAFSKCLTFNVGYIPETFRASEDPEVVDFLHIDLNSSAATCAALQAFLKLLSPRSVIVFDDYGWRDHVTTRQVVDEFAHSIGSNCIQLPTGQGVIFCNF